MEKRTISEELSRSCVEAASKVIDLIELLRYHGQLAVFSYTDFHSCISATIILLLNSILHSTAPQSPKIVLAMQSLKFMATGSESAKNGVRLIQSFISLAQRVIARLASRRNSPAAPSIQLESIGYNTCLGLTSITPAEGPVASAPAPGELQHQAAPVQIPELQRSSYPCPQQPDAQLPAFQTTLEFDALDPAFSLDFSLSSLDFGIEDLHMFDFASLYSQ
jgi:hypothetical protein